MAMRTDSSVGVGERIEEKWFASSIHWPYFWFVCKRLTYCRDTFIISSISDDPRVLQLHANLFTIFFLPVHIFIGRYYYLPFVSDEFKPFRWNATPPPSITFPCYSHNIDATLSAMERREFMINIFLATRSRESWSREVSYYVRVLCFFLSLSLILSFRDAPHDFHFPSFRVVLSIAIRSVKMWNSIDRSMRRQTKDKNNDNNARWVH